MGSHRIGSSRGWKTFAGAVDGVGRVVVVCGVRPCREGVDSIRMEDRLQVGEALVGHMATVETRMVSEPKINGGRKKAALMDHHREQFHHGRNHLDVEDLPEGVASAHEDVGVDSVGVVKSASAEVVDPASIKTIN